MPSNIPQEDINDHSFLAEELLIPMMNRTDSGRLQMFTSHSSQMLVLDNPETPRVFTRFENQVGKYSRGFKSVEKGGCTVVKIFEFNDAKKLILLKNAEGKYHIIEWNYTVNLTEAYGYINELNEAVEVGAELPEGTWIYKNGMYDDNLNLRFGLNLNAVFLPYKGLTFEDGIVISESAASRLTHTDVNVFYVVLNRNDVLIHIHGSKEEGFSGLPRVGETIENGMLCARRRINYATILDEFKDTEFNKIAPEDTIFYAEGMVTDITVFSNIEEDLNLPYNLPFKEIADTQREVYTDISSVITELKAKGADLSDDCNFWMQKANDYLNSEIPFSYDKRTFEGIILKVTVATTVAAEYGSKITGRYGSKGVISAILPDDQMPISECGKHRADVILNTLGVFGRMNFSQNFEQELNFIGNYIRDLNKDKSDKEFFDDVMDYYEIASPELHKFIKEQDSEEFLTQLISDWREHGIVVHQQPFFGSISLETMGVLYDRFPAPKIKLKDIHDPVIVGEIYYLKLKHESIKKFSARSSGMTSLHNLPYKSNERYKKGNAQYNSNPVKMGEQEFFNMALLENPEHVNQFIQAYSSSDDFRKSMLTQLMTEDASNIKSFDLPENTDGVSNSAQTVRAMIRGLGVNIRNVRKKEEE